MKCTIWATSTEGHVRSINFSPCADSGNQHFGHKMHFRFALIVHHHLPCSIQSISNSKLLLYISSNIIHNINWSFLKSKFFWGTYTTLHFSIIQVETHNSVLTKLPKERLEELVSTSTFNLIGLQRKWHPN